MKARFYLYSFGIFFSLFLGFVTGASAQPINIVPITIEDPDGNPMPGIGVELKDSSLTLIDKLYTNLSGVVEFTETPSGFPDATDYVVDVTTKSLLTDERYTGFIIDSASGTDIGGGIFQQPNTTLTLPGYPDLDRIDVTVVDTFSNPVNGARVFFNPINTSFPFDLFTSAPSGLGSFAFPDRDDYDITIEVGTYSEDIFGVRLDRTLTFYDSIADEWVQSLNFMLASQPPLLLEYLEVEVINVLGDPLEGVPVELINTIGDFVDSCTTDSSGACRMLSIMGGGYEIKLPITQFPDTPSDRPYVDTSASIIIDDTTAFFDSLAGGFVQREKLTLNESTRSVIVSVFEAQADDPTAPDRTRPVQGADLDLTNYEDFNDFYFGTTGVDGIARLPITETTSGFYSLNLIGEGTSSSFQELSISPGTEDVEVTMVVQTTNSSLTVSIEDSQGTPLVAQRDEFGFSTTHVNCSSDSPESPFYFDAEIPVGESSVTFNVFAGTYICSVYYGEGFAVQEVRVDVAPNQTAQARLVVSDPSTPVTIRFLDGSTGERLSTSEPLVVDVFSVPPLDGSDTGNSGVPLIDHYESNFTTNGEVTFELISGLTYAGGSFFDFNTSDSGPVGIGEFDQPPSFDFVVTGNNQVIEVEVRKADASVEVCLVDVNGTPITEGYAYAFSPGSFSFDDGTTVSNASGGGAGDSILDQTLQDDVQVDRDLDARGCATLPIFTGADEGLEREYYINAVPFFNEPDSGVLQPRERLVKLRPGQTRQFTQRMIEPNYTLRVLPSSSFNGRQLGDADFVFCSAEDGGGSQSFSEEVDPDSGALIIRTAIDQASPEAFFIFCGIFFDDFDGGTGDGYFGDAIFTPTRRTTEGSVTITLGDREPLYPNQTADVQINATTKITLPDGSEVTIPAEGIVENQQGVAVAFVYGTARSSAAVSKDYTRLTQFEFEPTASGEKVSQTNKNIKMCFVVPTERLAAEGASTSDLLLAHFNPLTKKYEPVRTEIIVEDGVTKACGFGNQFSIWNLIVDVGQQVKNLVPGTPRAKRVKAASKKGGKKRGKRSRGWRVSFKAPEGATDTTRFVYEFNPRVKNRKKCAKTTNFPRIVEVVGTDPFLVNHKGNRLCGRIKMPTGRSSKPSYRASRK